MFLSAYLQPGLVVSHFLTKLARPVTEMTYSSSRGPGSSLPTTLILLPGERMTVGLRRESQRRGVNEFLPSCHLLQQHSEDLIRAHVLSFGLKIEQTAVA